MTYRASDRDEIDDMEDGADARVFWQTVSAEPPLFNSTEEQVIAVARTDRLSSIEPAGWLDRLLGALFGLRPKRRFLADPRLEALRRAVVVSCHRRHLPDAQAAALRAAGFSLAQIRAIEARAA